MGYQTRTTLKTYFETGDKPTEAEFIDFLDSVRIQSKGATFTPAIVFDRDDKYCDPYIQSGALSITLGSNTNGQASYIYVNITTDSSALAFPLYWRKIKNEYANDSAVYGLTVYFDGTFYQYQVYKVAELDVTPPVLSTAIIEDSTKSIIDLTFSEAVEISVLGWSINTDGAALSITGVTGSGTSTPKFTLSRDTLGSETITLDYNSVTGDTEDAYENPLVTFITPHSVVNNVLQDLNFTSSLNVTRTTPGSDIVYTCNSGGTFGYMVADEEFDGDFDIIWDLLGTYGQSGTHAQYVGFDDDNVLIGHASWVISVNPLSATNAQVLIAGAFDGGITITTVNKLMIRRVGTTVTVWGDSGSGFVLLHTLTGSYSQTGIQMKFQGYGDGTDQTQLYNPKYKE